MEYLRYLLSTTVCPKNIRWLFFGIFGELGGHVETAHPTTLCKPQPLALPWRLNRSKRWGVNKNEVYWRYIRSTYYVNWRLMYLVRVGRCTHTTFGISDIFKFSVPHQANLESASLVHAQDMNNQRVQTDRQSVQHVPPGYRANSSPLRQ